MNKDNAKDYLPLVQALADGKSIQVLSAGEWKDAEQLTTLSRSANDYRIKPEPREIWFNELPSGTLSGPYFSEDAAFQDRTFGTAVRRYREVTE